MQDHASEDIWSTVSKFSLLRKQTRLFNNRCLYKGFCVLPFRSAGVCLRRYVDMIQTFVNLSGRYAILTASVFISISISSANPKK